MAGSNRLRLGIEIVAALRGRATIFFYLGIVSRMILAASCGSVAVASTNFARVSSKAVNSAWVMLSCSIRYLLPGIVQVVALLTVLIIVYRTQYIN